MARLRRKKAEGENALSRGLGQGSDGNGLVEALLARAAHEVGRLAMVAADASGKVAADLDRFETEGPNAERSDRDRIAADLVRTVAESVQELDAEAHGLQTALRRSLARLQGEETPATEPGRDPAEHHEVSAGIQLLVSQLAHYGMGRSEIAEQLRSDFGMANADEIIASVLEARPIPGEPDTRPPVGGRQDFDHMDRALPGNRGTGGETGPGVSESVRVLVMQMATAGSSREQITARLDEEFRLPDSNAVLSSILGERDSGS